MDIVPLDPSHLGVSTATAPGGEGATTTDPLLGKVLGRRYRLDALVGAGSMGRVYRATQLALGKTVAVKVLTADLRAAPEAIQRFEREAQAASRIDHPNSVAVFDFGRESDGTAFLAMEYLRGESLGALLRREGRLSSGACIALMSQVLAALAEAHARGIVHRDVKPENIMLVRSARDGGYAVKVTDFGIAKILQADGGSDALKLTATGMTQGSPAYMSPEQVQARPADARSDLYQCGVVLFEMIAGRTPFGGGALIDVMMRHVRAPAPSPRAFNLCCLPALERVILRALEKDPARRFPDAQAMRQALQAIVVDESVGAVRPRRSSSPAPGSPRLSATTVRVRALPATTPAPSARSARYGLAPLLAAAALACAAGAALTLRSGDSSATPGLPIVVVRAHPLRPVAATPRVVAPPPAQVRPIVFEPGTPDGSTPRR